MVSLRKATAGDAKAIRALIWRVKINPMDLDWRRFVVAVTEQNAVIGCGQIKPHGDGTLELASIAVVPEFQGQGIGKSIIRKLLAESSPPLYLTCRDTIESYYHQFGFQAMSYEQMPPYFKRISRIATLLGRLSPGMGQLRVMVKTA
jgi:N-acetylglutamate synthase-like GNAT family acetyltransferase